MIKIFRTTILIPIVLVLLSCSPTGKVTLLVVDDNNPINGAKVFVYRDGPGGVFKGSTVDKGLSNSKGQFISEATNYNGYIAYGASKEGYYDSDCEYQFFDRNAGRRVPWNPELKVLLRKIENPVPMYAKKASIEIPVNGKDIGFDLIAYDFVPPYGKGVYSDFILNSEKSFTDRLNFKFTITIKFNGDNGIIELIEEANNGKKTNGSKFKMPRYAPKSGYSSSLKLVWEKTRWGGNKISYRTNDWRTYKDYIFRIRSEPNESESGGAMYGKISAGMGIYGIRVEEVKLQLHLTYYVNPDHTKNLEFDPSKNLFIALPEDERVKDP